MLKTAFFPLSVKVFSTCNFPQNTKKVTEKMWKISLNVVLFEKNLIFGHCVEKSLFKILETLFFEGMWKSVFLLTKKLNKEIYEVS